MTYNPPSFSVVIVLGAQENKPTLPLNVILRAPDVSLYYLGVDGFDSSVISDKAEVTQFKSPNNLGVVTLERRDVHHGFIWGVILRPKDDSGATIALSAYGFNNNVFGSKLSLSSSTRYLLAEGVAPNLKLGLPSIVNNNRFIYIQSSSLTSYGRASVINRNQQINLLGYMGLSVGKPLVYNLLQYCKTKGHSDSLYGRPYLQGGIKNLAAQGFYSLKTGTSIVFNTTANQTITPSGINSAVIPRPDVSPRILYPVGIFKSSFGKPDVRSPVLMPDGIVHSTYGSLIAWFRVRSVAPAGIGSLDFGYPITYDPTQGVQATSVVTSAIFGDTAVRNKSRILQPAAIFDEVVEQWATVTNINRYYTPAGIDSAIYGDAFIYNKTPSIFVDSISQTEIGAPAVGYAIRTVVPSGFDRLLLGKPTLTKSPELAPKSFNTSAVSSLFISHRIRTVRPSGFIATLFGSQVAWYRYRYVSPKAWVSSRFGAPGLTHGVREVIAKGFVRDAYGRPWVSQGTRQLEPIGINKTYPTLHMVGGSREVKPAGFIATLFGTRIIPENIYAYPQGFTGVFGLANIRLNTQHLKPSGFISVGQQPADRWGCGKVYNLSQYIVQAQNFDRDNGLIPPAWSEWTLIENKDKQLNATGLGSLKFGYSKIDNNAAPLLPLGIAPPVGTRYAVSMIAHGVRHISADGIEAPIVSSWLVLYNDARVINPAGFVETQTGLASAENTRRYYSGVGRFEALETGTPMVSYAIRYVLLEPRYAIMPPQINLPVIDTWTKYATFNGYETAAYGSASLSVHFNTINPKWVHRNKVGEPQTRNLTPEVATYGHNSELFGAAGVRTQWRIVYASGDTHSLFGLAYIADTRRAINVRGWRSIVMAQKHTVIRTGAPPYSEQKISLDGWYDFNSESAVSGFGIYFDENRLGKQVPKVGINQNVLKPSGFDSVKFGNIVMWSNNIQIMSGIAIHNVPTGAVVRNQNRYITLSESEAMQSKVVVGRPRMSPHTIYSVKNAPSQAIQNHYVATTIYYIGESSGVPSGVNLGNPKIDNSIRKVEAKGVWSGGYGALKATLVRKVVKTTGFKSSRAGLPSIPFTTKEIVMFEKQPNMSAYGKPKLHIPDTGDKRISLKGFSSLRIPVHEAQLKIRYIEAVGSNLLLMGSALRGDNPFMWQGLRIGAHVPLVIGGADTSVFGGSMVSLRIRDMALEGWDSFVSEYDTANFNKRMKVSHARQPDMQSQRVSIDGFIAADYGNADFKFGQYFIKPDGNSNQFRKGGYHA